MGFEDPDKIDKNADLEDLRYENSSNINRRTIVDSLTVRIYF